MDRNLIAAVAVGGATKLLLRWNWLSAAAAAGAAFYTYRAMTGGYYTLPPGTMATIIGQNEPGPAAPSIPGWAVSKYAHASLCQSYAMQAARIVSTALAQYQDAESHDPAGFIGEAAGLLTAVIALPSIGLAALQSTANKALTIGSLATALTHLISSVSDQGVLTAVAQAQGMLQTAQAEAKAAGISSVADTYVVMGQLALQYPGIDIVYYSSGPPKSPAWWPSWLPSWL